MYNHLHTRNTHSLLLTILISLQYSHIHTLNKYLI